VEFFDLCPVSSNNNTPKLVLAIHLKDGDQNKVLNNCLLAGPSLFGV
jgi:hypothetical protein